jgi:RimJ/RimL family protein N-acetyltransferase
LRVGAQQLRLGRGWPFTATELSRAAALLELASQLAMRGPARTSDADRILLLRDGSQVRMRPATPSDAPLVAALHARSAPQTRRSRFLSPVPRLPADQLDALLGIAEGRPPGLALLAVTVDGGSAVGLANLDPEPDHTSDRPTSGRVAVLVEDAWHGRGLGTALLRRAADAAAEMGMVEVTALARPDDLGVTRLLRRAGLRPSAEIVDGTVRLRAPLPAPVP